MRGVFMGLLSFLSPDAIFPPDQIMCLFFAPSGAAIAGVYKAAGKTMMSFEAFVFGVGQSFCVVIISFLRILATL